MAGTTNFLQWNPSVNNQEDDGAYLADASRTGGCGSGAEFPSPTANKLFYQLSTMVAAFGQMLANKGYNVSDADVNSLAAILSNIVTNADGKGTIQILGFSPAPVYNAGQFRGFQMLLSGDITAATVGTPPTPGDEITFIFVQDSVGGHDVAWPAGFFNMPSPNTDPGSVSIITGYTIGDGTVHAKVAGAVG